MRFFIELVGVLEEEIRNFKIICKEKYCVLVFFVLFNNELCFVDIWDFLILKEIFEFVLKLCGMDKNIVFYIIKDIFEILLGFFVKKYEDIY